MTDADGRRILPQRLLEKEIEISEDFFKGW